MTTNSRLVPFWSYYGGKYRAAPNYPEPVHGTIVEPFAGAAGYSMRYPDRDVVLIEKYPVVAGVWRWLIGASPSDVRQIPEVEHVDELPSWVSQEARWFIGFQMNDACASPRKSLSIGARRLRATGRKFKGWCPAQRERIATQIDKIKHWKIIEGEYSCSPDVEATWFIDPPYQVAGKHYVHKMQPEDYGDLGTWCRERRGQVMACEVVGANWLPFEPFMATRAAYDRLVSHEVIWTNDTTQRTAPR